MLATKSADPRARRGITTFVFIIDTTDMGPEVRGGLVAVVGSEIPTASEKSQCVEMISRYVVEGWAIAADPGTPLGRIAALTAERGCVPFVAITGVDQQSCSDDVSAMTLFTLLEPTSRSKGGVGGLVLEVGADLPAVASITEVLPDPRLAAFRA